MYLGSCERVASYWSEKSWGLKAAPLLAYRADNIKISPNSQLGFSDFVRKGPSLSNLRIRREWDCLSQRAVTPVAGETETPSSPNVVKEEAPITPAKGFHKDLSTLPKPLSLKKLYSSSSDGAKIRVAYQGVPGAYSEDAVLKVYPNCETVPCDEYEAVFMAVELWLVDKAVLPIEDSVGGSIHRNYDSLLRHRLHIVGEVQMIVNHCLLGLPGVKKSELKRVLSHPLALNHCDLTLTELGVKRIGTSDSASAAQFVAAKGVPEMGAIASSRAAKIYGLDVLEEGIQDEWGNVTRCLMLAREPLIPGTERPHKTSIVFSLEEGPGLLFKALAVFAMRDINLSKIESRPLRKRPLRIVDDSNSGKSIYFDYLFYIDFEASMAEPRAQYALGHLQEFSRFIRVLGCYPKDTSILSVEP